MLEVSGTGSEVRLLQSLAYEFIKEIGTEVKPDVSGTSKEVNLLQPLA